MDQQGQDAPCPRVWLTNRISAGMKLGLENCDEMLKRLGNPQNCFTSIHVAGTNGKGSLCANLSALASKNDLLVGFFSSPHLITVEERIRVDGRPLNPKIFDKYLFSVLEASLIKPNIEPTFFETTFLISMLAFSEAKIDIAIIETGLGGRLDATRLVNASVCAITTISYDHSEILGNSLVEIAKEKAAIYRPDKLLFSLYHSDIEVRKVFENIAGKDLKWFKPNSNNGWDISKEYAMTIALHLGWTIKEYEISWPGRSPNAIEWIPGIKSIVSAAHNFESIKNDLEIVNGEYLMLLGMTGKSNLNEILSAFNKSSNCLYSIITEPSGGRNLATPSEDIIAKLKKLGYHEIEAQNNPIRAFKQLELRAKKLNSQVLIIGSIYLIGEIMNYIIKRDKLNLYDLLIIHPPSK